MLLLVFLSTADGKPMVFPLYSNLSLLDLSPIELNESLLLSNERSLLLPSSSYSGSTAGMSWREQYMTTTALFSSTCSWLKRVSDSGALVLMRASRKLELGRILSARVLVVVSFF